MRVVRWLGIAFVGLVAFLVVTGVVARFSDGPIALFPGGELRAGELYQGPEPDWTFARDIPEMEFQLLDPPRSRTIWLVVHDQKLYIVSGYMRSAIGKVWKKWPAEAERDGRAVIRIDGKRYERDVVRIRDAVQIEPLAAEIRRKYGVPQMSAQAALAGDAWFYALPPRGGAAALETAPPAEAIPGESEPE
jgi:hypothetical protein